AYCVGELRLSEDSAFKRIRVARKARQFPAIFEAIADGRLHLGAVVLLAPYLTGETADELLGAAAHKTKSEIEQLLAERFPRPEVATRVQAISSCSQTLTTDQLAPGPVETGLEAAPGNAGNHLELAPERVGEALQLAPGPVDRDPQHASGHVQVPASRARLTPLAPEHYALQVTIGKSTHDKLRYAQDLLSHQVPSGDLAEILDRALVTLIGQLEKRKFAATVKPRAGRISTGKRSIPAHVKRTVWQRDGRQCTFVSDTGRRCSSRKFLEFDHMDEVARGGVASVERIRLRCRAHNQYGAECTFGTEFMRQKRRAAAEARAAAKAREAAEAHASANERAAVEARAAANEQAAAAARAAKEARDVVPWLRKLGYRDKDARLAATHCEHIPDASLEERVRVALSWFPLRGTRTSLFVAGRAAAAPNGAGRGEIQPGS
ncbi:MAG: hypothetical protein ABIS67_12920, partial [Candidatus Eisenbacteria bacterium]